jgi:tRNA pseudouridine38-40 synthase
MKNIKLIIEYNGTNYSGWQSQKNRTTIQNIIESCLSSLTKESIKIYGSGRTDSGVHAYGQVASFKSSSKIPPDKYSYALNQKLPDDIVIVKSELVPDDFHARYSAIKKEYIYKIYNSVFPSAIHRNHIYRIRQQLDIDRMRNACRHFYGKHDFSSFMSTGSDVINTEREIFKSEIIKKDDIITYNIIGNGFLYNMVRIIVGTLIEAGTGKIKPDKIQEILKSKDRSQSGKTAPPHGLYLNKVYY